MYDRTRRAIRERCLPAALFLASLAGCQGMPERASGPTSFATDGCSMFPDRMPGGPDWRACCVEHDLAYWRGGTRGERLAADRALRTCVGERATALLGRVMYTGVRVAGGPTSPTPFRWGFGWPYGRGYQPLSASDEARLAVLSDAWLAQHPSPVCLRKLPSPALHESLHQ